MGSHLTPDIAIFIRVLELGSFVAAANETGYTSSGVSRMISRLEHSLEAKLLYRSTRQLSLTPEGEAFVIHARNILSSVETAEAEISTTAEHPRGHLRINCGTAYANHKLTPVLPEFSNLYPDITIDVSVSDRRINPITEQADITIRVGALLDSDLVAIPLGSVKRIIAASPGYISKHGAPEQPCDLAKHSCLLLSGFPYQANWPFVLKGERIDIAVKGRMTSDSAEALLRAAVAGLGIIRLGDFLGAEALASKQLVPVLDDYHVQDPQPISALIPSGRQSVPRVRALLDFLKAKC